MEWEIRTSGRWAGGQPDIRAARTAVAEFGPVDASITNLIEMVDADANPVRSHTIRVDFLSDMHRSLSVLGEFTSGVEASLGRDRAGTHATLSNAFEWRQTAKQKATFAIDVVFPDRGVPANS